MERRAIERMEDLSSEELERLMDGQPLAHNGDQELRELFFDLSGFARTVAEGGSWKLERAANLEAFRFPGVEAA